MYYFLIIRYDFLDLASDTGINIGLINSTDIFAHFQESRCIRKAVVNGFCNKFSIENSITDILIPRTDNSLKSIRINIKMI